MKITTNNKPRPLATYEDLDKKQQDYFDYIEVGDKDHLRFFNYRGSWYDYYEFERAPDQLKKEGWNGWQPESYFSAVLVRYFDKDGNSYDDSIVVGYTYW